MYDLFEFTKVLSYTEPYALHSEQLKLQCHAFQNTTDRSLLCLNFTTGKLFLWQKEFGHEPKYCWLPWYPKHDVENMCIDPTGSWLLTLSSDLHITIVPARSILDPSAAVDQLWTLDDVTEMHLPHRINGRVDCLTWWKTMCGDNVVILGTKVGFLVFVDLVLQRELLRLDLNEHIVNIQILHSDSFTSSSALVSTKTGSHWFLTLEEKLEIDLSIIQDSCYFSVQNQYRTIYRLLGDQDREEKVFPKFLPRRSSLFPSHVQLTAQYARGRHFIAAHDLSTSLYQIYSSEMGQSPVFVYKLPIEADEVLYTDKLMFASQSQDGATLKVVANQLSEVSEKERESSGDPSVVQSFRLDPGEFIYCIKKNCFPFYWHSRDEVTSQACDVNIRSHSVFDGCLVVSSRAVYECRPRVSPERLFVSLCASNASLSRLESLSLLLGLDVCQLTLQVAQWKLKHGEKIYAEKLMQWAKVSPLQRCLLYAEYGQQAAALCLCEALLEGDSEHQSLETESKHQVLMVYIQLLIASSLKSKNNKDAEEGRIKLTSVLIRERMLLPKRIWEMLYECGMHDVAWHVARTVGEVSKVVDMYTQKRKLHVEGVSDTALQDGVATYWAQGTLFQGSLLDHLKQSDIIHLLESHHTLLSQLLDLIEDGLSDLDTNELLKVMDVLDPRGKQMLLYLHRYLMYRDKLDTSLSDRLVDMVMLFILSVLHLNKQSDIGHVTDVPEQASPQSASVKDVVSTWPALMSCSLNKTVIVMKNRLWEWGRSQYIGRPEAELDEVCFRGFSNLSVVSVSCGYRHALAITTHGVFSWGSNNLGQLGHSDSLSRSEPEQVAKLQHEQVVQVSCGQYHSLALTEEGRVYSWGWGVHGQLGHGNPKDVSVPMEIAALKGHMVVMVRGGQGHSVVLTRQGVVYSFGCNAFGQLGVGDNVKRSLPVRVKIEQPVHLIDTRYFHTVAVTTKNSIYQWGLSPLGLKQKVINAKKSRGKVAQSVSHVTSHQFPRLGPNRNIKELIAQVVCGTDMTVVVTVTGELYSWGRNNEGQLGIGRMIMKEQFPVTIPALHGVCIQQLAGGPDFVLALDNTGRVWGWGRNDQGQKTGMLPTERKKLEGLSAIDVTAGVSANQLKYYLDVLSPFLNEHLLLRKSVQLSSHHYSAAICDHMCKHTEAFSHRLKALESCDLKGGELADVLSQTLGNTLKELKTQSGDKQYELQSVLQQLLVFWGEREIDALEKVLTQHFLQLVLALVIIIDKQSQSKDPSFQFSPSFMMRLSLLVKSQLQQGTLTPSTLLSGLHSHLGSVGRTKIDCVLSGDIMRERLWWESVERLQSINSNQKPTGDAESMQIYVEDVAKKVQESQMNEESDVVVLLFSCGHKVMRSEFKDALQKEKYGSDDITEETGAFVQSGNQSISRLDNNNVVSSYYRNATAAKLACPSCLFKVINSHSHK